MYEFIFKKIKSCKLKKINSFILNKKYDKKIKIKLNSYNNFDSKQENTIPNKGKCILQPNLLPNK